MSASDISDSAETCFTRGQLLRSQHRTHDAIAAFQQALGADPNHTLSYLMLALCWMEAPDTAAKAVDAATRAVALEPRDAFAHAVLALALNGIAKEGDSAGVRAALARAEEAINLDPDSDFSHAVAARLHLRLRDFPRAEAAARQALQLDTENTMATEVLSAALLMQRKDADNKGLIDYHLQRSPDDDGAHASAGWQALMEADHKRANQHFVEALRLNPMNEGARMGLVESYRARSWVYRLQLRFAHFMNQFTEGRQTAIMIGGFIGYQVLRGYLNTVSPFWTSVLVGAWLTFALWSHLARGLSSFFILWDRFARQSLRPREYWEGLVVGGLIVLAPTALLLGYAHGVSASFTALACLLAAVANAAAFTNDHHTGKYIYGIVGAAACMGAVYGFLGLFAGLPLPMSTAAGALAILLGVVVSWLRPLRVFYA